MSNVGVIPQLRTPREIYEAAMAARDRLAIGRAGRVPLDMEWLLERRVRPLYGVEPDIRDDNDPEVANVFALYDAGKNTLLIRNSVLLKAAHVEDPEAIFTIAHELGHICLHSNPTQFRRELPKKLPAKWCNPEWQADRFGMEFLTDRSMLAQWADEPGSAARYFRTPLRLMHAHLVQLRAEGVLSVRTSRPSPIEQAIQGDLDL